MKHMALLAFVLFAQSGYADTFDNCLQVEEEDGSPSNVGCQPLHVPNGSLTDNGTHYSLAFPSSGLASTDIDTSLELDNILTDDTGSGAAVFATSPALTTPNIGVATGTSLTTNSSTIHGANGFSTTAGNTNGAAFSAQQNSLTSGDGFLATSNSNSMTGNLFRGSYTGTSSGKLLSLTASSTSYTGIAVKITNAGSGNSLVVEDVASDSTPFLVDAAGGVTIPGDLTQTGNIIAAGTLTSSRTSDLGWSVVSGANTACNTTCTSACVFGFDSGTPTIVDCADATADKCVCAGAS